VRRVKDRRRLLFRRLAWEALPKIFLPFQPQSDERAVLLGKQQVSNRRWKYRRVQHVNIPFLFW